MSTEKPGTTLRWAGAATVAAGLLVGGAGVAAATEPPPTQEPITLTAEQSAQLCQERIPTLLASIDRATQRITGDATTAGSTARLTGRAEDARAAGRTERAARLDERVAGRVGLLDRLDDATGRIETFRDENCAE